jgi:hypothetical protein
MASEGCVAGTVPFGRSPGSGALPSRRGAWEADRAQTAQLITEASPVRTGQSVLSLAARQVPVGR